MIVALTITKFRKINIPFAFIGMAILRVPLWMNRKCSFWKLMGSGKDAQVDLAPDFKHWAILTTWESRTTCDAFYKSSFPIRWFRLFGLEEFTVYLNPLSAHGLWSGKKPFTPQLQQLGHSGKIAVITRAAIRFSRLKEFRNHIGKAAQSMRSADGFILSAGIGENPFLDQATFSIWENAESMKSYAYKTADHANVIKLTRERNWYSEELFARFEILHIEGTLNNQSIHI